MLIFSKVRSFDELIIERTMADLQAARARGWNEGRPTKTAPAKQRLPQASTGQAET